MELLPSDREAYRKVFQIAWPAVVESVLISLISVVDTAMVSGMGKEAIAAVGISGQPRSIALSIIFALNVGVTAVVSRRKGEDNCSGANRCLKQSLLISIGLAVLLSALCILFAKPILLFSGAQSDYIEEAVLYCRIIMAGMVFTAVSQTLTAAQRGCGRTIISMKTNLMANLVNVALNYLLIGGNLGFPALGVAGAAIASVAGFLVSALVAARSALKKDSFLYLGSPDPWRFDRETVGSIARVGGSAALEQVVFCRIGYFAFGKMMASLGTLAYATHQICNNLMSIALSFAEGFCVTASALLGQSLGERRPDKARLYVEACQRIAFIGALLLALGFIFLRYPLMHIYSRETQVVQLGAAILIVVGLMTNIQTSQNIYTAALRGAGDTRYVAWVSMVSITLLRPGLGWLFAYPLGGGLAGAWLACWLDQFVRLVFASVRFYRGRWKDIRI